MVFVYEKADKALRPEGEEDKKELSPDALKSRIVNAYDELTGRGNPDNMVRPRDEAIGYIELALMRMGFTKFRSQIDVQEIIDRERPIKPQKDIALNTGNYVIFPDR